MAPVGAVMKKVCFKCHWFPVTDHLTFRLKGGRVGGLTCPHDQWSFLVPLKGGRYHIITHLAIYTTYIPLIYIASSGVICYLPPFRGTRNNHWHEKGSLKNPWVFRQTAFQVDGGRFSWGKACVFWRNDVMYSIWTLQREWRYWDPMGKMFYYTYMFSLKQNVCETYTTTKTSRNQYDWKGGFPILSKHKVARCGSVDGSDIW